MSGDEKRLPELVPDKSLCCGCGACAAVCPKAAIEMVADDEGFLFPEVNETECVGCLICERVCAFKGDMGCLDSLRHSVG